MIAINRKYQICFLFYLVLFALLVGCKNGGDDMSLGIGPIEENPEEGIAYDGRLNNKLDLQVMEMSGQDAAYDGEKWVVVGDQIYVSSDALQWEKVNNSLSNHLVKIIWNGESFVAIGTSEVISSKDGYTWSLSAQFSYPNDSPKDIVWTGERFILISGFNSLFTSVDGAQWQAVENAPPLGQILWTGSLLVGIDGGTVSSGEYAYVSTDGGLTWSDAERIDNSWGSIRYLTIKNGIIYGFGSASMYKSTNGLDWEEFELETWNVKNPVVHNGKFYGTVDKASAGSPVIDLGGIVFSEDGINWSKLNTGLHSPNLKIKSSPAGLLAVGEDFLWSENGINWELRVPRMVRGWNRVKWEGDRGIFASGNGFLMTKDLQTFDLFAFKWLGQNLSSVCWTGDQYIGVGNSGKILISPDGQNLSSPNSPTNDNLVDVCAGPNGIVAVGTHGTILFSQDGLNWEDYSLQDETAFFRVEFLGNSFFAIGNNGIFTSQNGTDWQGIDVTPEDSHSPTLEDICYNGQTYVAITERDEGLYYTSMDAINWVERKLSPGNYSLNFVAVDYTGHEFIALEYTFGSPMKLIASNDGILWEEVFSLPSTFRGKDMAWSGNGFLIAGEYDRPIAVGHFTE